MTLTWSVYSCRLQAASLLHQFVCQVGGSAYSTVSSGLPDARLENILPWSGETGSNIQQVSWLSLAAQVHVFSGLMAKFDYNPCPASWILNLIFLMMSLYTSDAFFYTEVVLVHHWEVVTQFWKVLNEMWRQRVWEWNDSTEMWRQ